MEKYYTPEVEEFHVGFEYEAKRYQDFWKQCFYTLLDEFPFIQMELDSSYIRVKYLDKADIESLGFILNEKAPEDENGYLYEFISSHYSLRFNELHKQVIIYSTLYYMLDTTVHYAKNTIPVFIGKIKNKSELKKLLKQLCITK